MSEEFTTEETMSAGAAQEEAAAEEKDTHRRPRKTVEEKVEDIDKRIAYHENQISALKQKKEDLLHPVTYASVVESVKKRNISPRKLAEMIEAQFSAK